MTDAGTSRSRAAEEAARWHARLGRPSVSAADLDAFRLWRAQPGHAEAYREIEALWRTSGALATDPDLAALVRQTTRPGRRPELRPGRKMVLPGLALAVVSLVLLSGALMWVRRDPVYETAVGEQRTVRLADGSTIELDTATRLQVHYRANERRLELLGGQALFTVAHDAARPFVVHSGDARVTAVGTVFEVRRAADGALVTLVSGVVEVRDAPESDGRAWRLSPGQQLDTAARQAAARPVDIQAETSWTQGRLVFAHTPLTEAVAEVNRYLDRPIVLEAGLAGDVQVNGAFNTGDREAFAAAVVDLFQLDARARADGALVLSDRTPSK